MAKPEAVLIYVGTLAAGCGSSTPAYCTDASQLKTSVGNLGNVDVAKNADRDHLGEGPACGDRGHRGRVLGRPGEELGERAAERHLRELPVTGARSR
jgi:hypothetical protein